MFTWVCPKCGAEVPPSYAECPNCAAATGETPPVPIPPVHKESIRPQRPKSRSQLPMWVLSLIFGLAFLAFGAIAYFGYGYLSNHQQRQAVEQSAMPAAPPTAPDKQALYGRFIEITGLRLTEDSAQKAQIRVTVVNHSGGEIPDLTLFVALRTTADKPGEPPRGTFTLKVPSLGPYEAKDFVAPVDTKLRAYELPDWQFLRADAKIVAP